MKNENFLKKSIANSSGMVLIASLMVSFIVGLASIAILRNVERKNKVKSVSDVSNTAKAIKTQLMMALNSDLSWQKTKNENSSLINNFTAGTTSPEISVYQVENGLLIPANSPTSGFTFNGTPCTTFNSQNGSNDCPFKYVVKIKSVAVIDGQKVPTVSAELTFKAADNKFILNTQVSEFTFDYTPSVDVVKTKTFCESIGATYNSTTNLCSQQMTTQTNACPPGQAYRGVSSATSNYCAPIIFVPKTCLPGEYAYGFDSHNNIVCRAL